MPILVIHVLLPLRNSASEGSSLHPIVIFYFFFLQDFLLSLFKDLLIPFFKISELFSLLCCFFLPSAVLLCCQKEEELVTNG